MEFAQNEEQEMLTDTVARFADRNYGAGAIQAGISGTATPQTLAGAWSLLAEIGIVGLLIPEEFGGMGGTATDTMIVMKELGRRLAPVPFVSSSVIAGTLIARAGSATQRSTFLPALSSGKIRMSLAALEAHSRFDTQAVRTSAAFDGNSYRLRGHKAVVLDGDSADHLIVSAVVEGVSGNSGLTLFIVDRTAVGVEVKSFNTIDGRRSAEVVFTEVVVEPSSVLGAIGTARAELDIAVDRGVAALCAEAVGAMEELCAITADYLRTRKQFKQPLASFQVLQHRFADMLIAVEQARSGAYMAASSADGQDESARRSLISTAKFLVGRAGQFVGQQAVQLHGGIGMTDELAVGRYFKRLISIDMTWGNADWHLGRFSRSLLNEA